MDPLAPALPTAGPAARRWAAELAAWRIDPQILQAAPESPYAFPPELFRVDAAPPGDTPSLVRARERLPAGGSVLDVGCGGGAASLPLAPPAAAVVGVDERPAMLELFLAGAQDRGVAASAVEGRWPDVGDDVDAADVVVCSHVAYNVPDLAAFARALDAHARRRVVLEVTERHPWAPLGSLWEHFHGQPRPAGPAVDLLREVLAEAGLPPVQVARWARPARSAALPWPAYVSWTRRRLCLPAEREPEVAALLDPAAQHREDPVVTLWWDRPA